MAQTPDGYLWLGTEFGLLRFDGVRAVPWQPPGGQSLPDSEIRSLLAGSDGTLWIGTTYGGLASWKGGDLTTYPRIVGLIVNSLVEDRDGTIWVAAQTTTPTATICEIRNGSSQCYGQDGSLGSWVTLYQDRAGRLWAATSNGLLRWRPGPPELYALPNPLLRSLCDLAEGDNGALLIATTEGIAELRDGKIAAYLASTPHPEIPVGRLLEDRNGALWVGTYRQGLRHVHQGAVDAFAKLDGLSSDVVTALFEDREANIWVATRDGIDRFRELAAPPFSANQRLPNLTSAVLAARDGSVWISPVAGSLSRWRNGRVTMYGDARRRQGDRVREPPQSSVSEVDVRGLPDGAGSLFEDSRGRVWVATTEGVGYLENDQFVPIENMRGGYFDSIAEDRFGNVWIASRTLGLFRWAPGQGVQQTSWAALGNGDPGYRLASDSAGGLWIGNFWGGVALAVDGQVRASYSTANGLGRGRVKDLRVDRDGTLWIATEGGLSRLKNGRIATLTSRNGLPCDSVDSTIEDDGDSTWLYMACGFTRIARSELDAWGAAVDDGRDVQPMLGVTVFDSGDGVRGSAEIASTSPHLTKAVDGRLWFVGVDGVSVIDPGRLPYNALPPPVHVEQIVADRKVYTADSAATPVRLPPRVRDLQIDYTALSFVAPEKMLFRYKLEDYDREWHDAGPRRQAFYNDLPPGHYRFRVTASNNSGVWNEAGAALDFSVAPAYYQTTWFRASCAAVFLALLGVVYELRRRHLERQFGMRIEERVGERTRIARELHDTLLQTFQGILLMFQAAAGALPDRPAEAQQRLAGVINRAEQAITEGRDAVRALRVSTLVTNDLARDICAFGEKLAAEQPGQSARDFRVSVAGASRDLVPLVRDEIFRIAREALRNAFQHAQAERIEVGVRYGRRRFRMSVRDNGHGIPSAVLAEGGRKGHFGLTGMRERAQLAGGKLAIRSGLDSGTEIELTIPASRAYARSSRLRRWLSRRS